MKNEVWYITYSGTHPRYTVHYHIYGEGRLTRHFESWWRAFWFGLFTLNTVNDSDNFPTWIYDYEE
jgi:hypothetical protein